jgi:hypothetical protein
MRSPGCRRTSQTVPIFRKPAAAIQQIFAEVSSDQLLQLEASLTTSWQTCRRKAGMKQHKHGLISSSVDPMLCRLVSLLHPHVLEFCHVMVVQTAGVLDGMAAVVSQATSGEPFAWATSSS